MDCDGIRKDSETGEFDHYAEEETNEINHKPSYFDEETGEPDNNRVKILYKKAPKFHIPQEYLRKDSPHDEPEEPQKQCTEENFTPAEKTQLFQMKEKIMLGYQGSRHLMVIIPSFFLFTKLTAVIISISEILIHAWAHRKNSKNTDKSYFYQSPLHILSSQFCALCQAERENNHIHKIQTARTELHRNLQQMTKSFA